MKRIVNLNTIPKVKEFAEEMQNLDGDINVFLNRYCIDGTSILGLLSLDLSKNLVVEFIGNKEEELVKFANVVKKYEVNENE